MNLIDWLVLFSTIGLIAAYGVWKTKKQQNLDDYIRGGRESKWFTIGLSVMATQASAITFLSTPGQAYESGMGFIQFYFGLPLALILVSIFAVPRFYNSNVFTAYEFLEKRFDLKTRLITAFLFLIQRGLAAGITIYAPAIVLSTVLGWDLNLLNIAIGIVVIIYTVSGGTKAVNLTQKWQMAVILAGMAFAFYTLLSMIGTHLGFADAIRFAGESGKMNIIDFNFDPSSRYTIWSGLTGGLFLSLSYFGTDQSQVQRYLSASSIKESRMGLMFNAVLKIPMQFLILLTGVLLFVFYQMNERPMVFNEPLAAEVIERDKSGKLAELNAAYQSLETEKLHAIAERGFTANDPQLAEIREKQLTLTTDFHEQAELVDADYQLNDADYVFIRFILDFLPHGAIGLLIAVILSAGMSSTAGELNALAATTMNDFYSRLRPRERNEQQNVRIGKWITVGWGVMAITFALMARLFDNLIELVNVLGSLFYGTILGVFVCAFFLKHLKGAAVFWSAIAAELLVILLYIYARDLVGYLWFNAIGCVAVLVLANLYHAFNANVGAQRSSS